jgi:hypothetical protein
VWWNVHAADLTSRLLAQPGRHGRLDSAGRGAAQRVAVDGEPPDSQFDSIGWGPDMARKFSLNSVEGSWLDESDKSALRMAFRREIAALDKEFGYQTAAPTV